MKKTISLLTVCLVCASCFSQQNFNDSIAQSRIRLTHNAMITLGGWATANIAAGFIVAGQSSGETKYLWRMNAYWNFFNLGLAGIGYAGLQNAMHKSYRLSDNDKAQHTIEKLYAFNSGLDLAYIAGGFYLHEKGKTQNNQDKKDQFRGFGTSIAIQGSFLLVMDAVMFSLHHRNTFRVNNKLEQLDLKAGPGGLSLSYTF